MGKKRRDVKREIKMEMIYYFKTTLELHKTCKKIFLKISKMILTLLSAAFYFKISTIIT